jgi:D-arginine dehydrogenase
MIYDVAIIGAGIGGASLAAEIAGQAKVLLLEAEDQPGYHSTGRSAAFWDETYGGPDVQPLTTASGAFLSSPPPEFAEKGFLTQRGALFVGTADDASAFDTLRKDFAHSGVTLDAMTHDEAAERVPGMRSDWSRFLYQKHCADIDVGRLHNAYLSFARRSGVELVTRARVEGLDFDAGVWTIRCGAQSYCAATIVNAGGAWADDLAGMAGLRRIGIQPYRRTIAQLRVEPAVPADMPLVIHINGDFYLKPESGGRIWLSPHDETPVPASDVAPEELDVAIAIDRLEHLVDWRIAAVERKWAGLRSFAPDRLPVFGFDPNHPAFFWCAGQGGFGIQTAPASARLAASLLLGEAPHPSIAHIDVEAYAASRFGLRD